MGSESIECVLVWAYGWWMAIVNAYLVDFHQDSPRRSGEKKNRSTESSQVRTERKEYFYIIDNINKLDT